MLCTYQNKCSQGVCTGFSSTPAHIAQMSCREIESGFTKSSTSNPIVVCCCNLSVCSFCVRVFNAGCELLPTLRHKTQTQARVSCCTTTTDDDCTTKPLSCLPHITLVVHPKQSWLQLHCLLLTAVALLQQRAVSANLQPQQPKQQQNHQR